MQLIIAEQVNTIQAKHKWHTLIMGRTYNNITIAKGSNIYKKNKEHNKSKRYTNTVSMSWKQAYVHN